MIADQIEAMKTIKKNRQEFPFYFKIYKKNKEFDFVLCVNLALLSGLSISRREVLKTVAHEAIHIVEQLRNMTMDFESVEQKAEVIVNEYERLSKKKD